MTTVQDITQSTMGDPQDDVWHRYPAIQTKEVEDGAMTSISDTPQSTMGDPQDDVWHRYPAIQTEEVEDVTTAGEPTDEQAAYHPYIYEPSELEQKRFNGFFNSTRDDQRNEMYESSSGDWTIYDLTQTREAELERILQDRSIYEAVRTEKTKLTILVFERHQNLIEGKRPTDRPMSKSQLAPELHNLEAVFRLQHRIWARWEDGASMEPFREFVLKEPMNPEMDYSGYAASLCNVIHHMPLGDKLPTPDQLKARAVEIHERLVAGLPPQTSAPSCRKTATSEWNGLVDLIQQQTLAWMWSVRCEDGIDKLQEYAVLWGDLEADLAGYKDKLDTYIQVIEQHCGETQREEWL